MSAFTPASEMLLRHCNDFTSRHILFAGELSDDLPAHLDCLSRLAHTQQFHHWQRLNPFMQDRVSFSLLAPKNLTSSVDTLIYYWPKNKYEAQFQLYQLLSLLPVDGEVFIVGENRSGVRSAESILTDYCHLHKIDSARRCSLYHGMLIQKPQFQLEDYWQSYPYNDLHIKTLPGVFSHNKLDEGSQLLISTFTSQMNGKILDIGCGTGVLAAALARQATKTELTLCDVSAAALSASQATLNANGLKGEVLASNIFSEISGRFDIIITNPPFHQGRKASLYEAQQMIELAPNYLKPGGELRLVANSFLPYASMLQQSFRHYHLLARNPRFKIYQALMPG